jgi:hypothetical protein
MSESTIVAEPQSKLMPIKSINYVYKKTVIGTIPEKLSYLFTNIDKSKSILLLKNNWDDEGSEKYEETTWVSSVKFLFDYAKTLFQNYSIEIKSPKIYPGPKSSIDIIWEVEKYRLVVNVNKNGEDAMFYADNYKNQITEGTFKLTNFDRFLLPIAI